MERLYVTLNEIAVKSPYNLAKPVDDMTKAIANLSNVTDIISQVLNSSKNVLSGNQFDKACSSVSALSGVLIDVNEDMFNLQEQIYELEVKVEKFDQIAIRAVPPRRIEIRKVKINTQDVFKFVRQDYINLANSLESYVLACEKTGEKLERDAVDVGIYWRDPQYDRFLRFVDEIKQQIKANASVLGDYKRFLDGIIRDLS